MAMQSNPCYVKPGWLRLGHIIFVSALLLVLPLDAARVRVATLNLKNYLSVNRVVEGVYRRDYPKSELQKAALRHVIKAVDPDILAVQEMGPEPYLKELQRDLGAYGIDYPHIFLLEAADPDRHLAFLSRLPPIEVLRITSLDFKYFEARETVKRGLLGAVFQTDGIYWTLFNVHLKSLWTVREDDQESRLRREREAIAVRDFIKRKFLPGDDNLYLIIGDLNSTLADKPLQRLLKSGSRVLAEVVPASDSRGETWTYYYAKEDVYSRFDYILSSPSLLPRIVENRGTVVDLPQMLIGSDHRLIYIDLDFERTGP